jgi:hypothetical protein
MIELMFVACLSVANSGCEEKSMIFVETPMQLCMLRAQGELASWTESNPGWTIRRWSCRNGGSTEHEA